MPSIENRADLPDTHVTAEWLRQKGACGGAIDLFVRVFPKGFTLCQEAKVTPRQAEHFNGGHLRTLADYLVGLQASDELVLMVREMEDLNYEEFLEMRLTKKRAEMFLAALWEYER